MNRVLRTLIPFRGRFLVRGGFVTSVFLLPGRASPEAWVPYPLVSSLHVFKPSSLPYGASAPAYGALYHGITLLGVKGFSSLLHNCLKISIRFFIAAILLNLLTVILNKYEKKYVLYRFIPSPMCMAIPFYLGAYCAIDMCIGSLTLFIWEKKNKKSAKEITSAVASGMICGDSLWSVPTAIMSMFGVKAPIFMKFLSASVNTKVVGCFGWFINVHGLLCTKIDLFMFMV
ncbi:probable metal-nicotianamine transporter YSL7 [Tanacetum coccineum]